MGLRALLRKRGETPYFSRSNYEVVFSIFMVALAYFYRASQQIDYPEVLYLFMSLLAANFAFNRIFAERSKASLWLVDAMLLSNVAIISAIVYRSGGHDSYFWVLYLLPVFTAALAGQLAEVVGTTVLCVLADAAFAAAAPADASRFFSLGVKTAVFVFSAVVIFRSALARRRLETEISFKRLQVERLMSDAEERDIEAAKEASAAEMGRISAGLLHDLGNIVSIMLISAEIMANDERPSQADAKRVEHAARMARGLVDGALAVIRGGKYNFREADIREPIDNAVALLCRQARGKGVDLSVGVEAGLPHLRISVPHVQRVVVNALSNAISFLDAGGHLQISARRDGEFVRVLVEDDGPGFPAKLLEDGIRQFGTTRGDKGGTGLGLYNSKEIVRKHGGEMSIRNRLPSGAVVEFTLPLSGPPA